MHIISRYLRKELLLVFLFVLGAFFFLYVLIDYSIHLKMFNQGQLSLGNIFFYYLWQLSEHLNILLPLSLMIATIKVLTSMNVHGELSALFSAGVSFKRFYRPFLQIAVSLIVLSYLNIQFVQPHSLSFINGFKQKHIKNSKSNISPVNVLPLAENALLIYQNFEEKTKVFTNAFLITNFNEVYRIKTLSLKKTGAYGEGVDVLVRNHANKLIKKESRPTCFFSKVLVDPKKLVEKDILPRMQSLTTLYHKLSLKSFSMGSKINDKEAEIATYFSYKICIAWFPLLAILAPPCFCLRSNRSFPLFFIYTGFLFGFFAIVAALNAFVIISSHQILPSFWGVFLFIVPLFSFVGFRYSKL